MFPDTNRIDDAKNMSKGLTKRSDIRGKAFQTRPMSFHMNFQIDTLLSGL